jgi:hypothetical protein
MMKYSNLREKLASARRMLMLPHPTGEADSIFFAFCEIHKGLENIDRNALEGDVEHYIGKLDSLMDTSGIEDSDGEGLFKKKALTLDESQKSELSATVDDLIATIS